MTFAVVLVRPGRPANVGAAARALKNFGLSDLRLVGARTGLPGDAGHAEARALAWNAADVLEGASVHERLGDAVADLGLVVGATARRQAGVPDCSPRALAAEVAVLPAGTRAGCVFGPEDHGLANEELDRLRGRLTIATAADQPSLNLAQAVVLVAYEVSAALALGRLASQVAPEQAPAREEEIERLDGRARTVLLRAGYLNPEAPQHVAGELRRLLARARPTSREVTLLLGLLAQLDWALRHGARDDPA